MKSGTPAAFSRRAVWISAGTWAVPRTWPAIASVSVAEKVCSVSVV
jgi:hypothetical protein